MSSDPRRAAKSSTPAGVAVTGASGFLGGRIVRWLAHQPNYEIRALVRRRNPPPIVERSRLAIVRGNMTDQRVLAQLLRPGCSVINLAYDADAPAEANIEAAEALAAACVKFDVKRLIHGSTTVVVGKTAVTRIDETTDCHPLTPYEKNKLAVERLLLEKACGKFELVILRPTAVFGAGGRNLIKLARDLKHGPRLTNYLRSCAYGRRRLNLVEVDNVSAAAAYLLEMEDRVDQEVFIISDDDDPHNNFQDVERNLMHTFGIADYPFPRIAVPKSVLSLLLRTRGRSLNNPDTVFSSDKLINRGFSKPVKFTDGVRAFAQWYQTEVG